MIFRVALLGIICAGLLGFGAVAWLSFHGRPPADAPEKAAQTAMLVVAREVRAGSLLRTEDLEAKTVNSNEVPAGSLSRTPLLSGASSSAAWSVGPYGPATYCGPRTSCAPATTVSLPLS